MKNIDNVDGVLTAKYGMYNGKKEVFTHRDPSTGYVFGPDIPIYKNKQLTYGIWVPYDDVEWVN